MEKTTVCKHCEWHKWADGCSSPDAPIKSFVTGYKDNYRINTDGKCTFYKDRQQS